MLPLLADAAAAQVVINEIDYDQVGADTAEFIELKNTGAMTVNLDTFSIRLINGGAPIPGDYSPSPIDLPDVDLAAGDYFVISGNAAAVSNTDFVVGSFTIQNGSPDAMQLLDGAAVQDTVSYEGTTTGFSEGTGAAAADDNVTPNIGLSRSPDGADTDDNDTDISRRCITPGEPNGVDTGMCPTPIIVRATKTDSLVSVLGVSGDVDADGFADPGDTVSYTVEIESLGVEAPDFTFDDVLDTNTTLVPGSVRVTPIALDESYDATCNTSITVPAASGVLANDVDPDAVPPLSNTGVTAVGLDTGATSGTVTLGTDGSFTYDPAPGFTGIDTFAYTARDADSLDSVETGIVSVTVGTDCIWFIDNTPAGAGNMGTLSDPLSTIAALNIAQGTASGPQAGDLILLFTGSYTTGANLLASQRFIGQGVAPATAVANAGITLAPFSSGLPAAGTRPTVSSTDNGIDLASGNTVRGLDIGNTTGFGLAGTGVGTSTVDTLAISGTGGALSIMTGTLAVSLDSITSTSSTGDGISLSNVGGSFAVTGSTAVSNSLFDGIDISNSAASFTFPTVAIDSAGGLGVKLTSNIGPVTFAGGSIGATNDPAGNAVGIAGGTANVTVAATINSDTARAVEVTNRMGGTVTFSAAIDEDGTGINLTSNAGGTISFSGGMTLDTGSSTAFNATGGGIINVTGVNTIGASNALDGTAVNIADTVIGAGGVTFRSISVDQSPAGGATAAAIILDDTGTGAFTITGTGTTDGSGGTIQDVVEDAIRLFNTDGAVSISNMNIEDIGNTSSAAPGHHGIDGQQVDGGLTLDNVNILRVTDSAIHGEAPGGGSTTWNGLTLTDSKLQFANRFHLAGLADGGGADEAMVTIEGISGTVDISRNDFDDGSGFINLFTASSGTVDITVETNTFDDGRKDLTGLASVGSSGVRVNTTGAIDADIRIGGDPNSGTSTKGNTFVDTGSDASIFISGFSAGDNANVDLTVAHNTVTVLDHTSPPGLCPTLATCAFDFPNGGIGVESRGSGTFEATISYNTLIETQNSGGLSTGSLRVDVSGEATEVIVKNNDIRDVWDGTLFIRADDADGNGARGFLEIKDNIYTNGTGLIGELGSGDDLDSFGLANSTAPFLPNRYQVRNGAVLNLTIDNDDMVLHETSFAPNNGFGSHDLLINGDAVGGTVSTFNVLVKDSVGPYVTKGFRLRNDDHPDGGSPSALNLSAGVSGAAAAFNIVSAQAQTVLNGNSNNGTADVQFTGTNIVTTTPTLPVVFDSP